MTLRPDTSPAPGMEVLTGSRYSSAYQLNPLWERVVKTQRIPPEVDLQEVLTALKHRLRDPEKEVRQHALRVLVDLVPVLRASLDVLLPPLLNDLLQNLGHPAPAVRRGSLDALRIYVSHSDNKEYIINEICSKCLEKNSLNNKHQEDVTMGVILALPSLIQPALGFLGNSSDVMISVIKALSSKLFQMIYQEVAMRSLVRIRDLIGTKTFDEHLRSLDYSVKENFNLLCNIYDLPISNEKPIEKEKVIELKEESKDNDNNNNSHDDEDNSTNNEKSEELFISEPPSQLLESENKGADFQPRITVDVDKSDNIPNGKIILETEISFDSQTAITMTILEEDDNVLSVLQESEDDAFDYTTYNRSVVKVLTDSEIDDYEDVRRTPRRVRFGGEIVKMRTPDSDTIHNSDADEIIEVNSNNKTEQIKIIETKRKAGIVNNEKAKETEIIEEPSQNNNMNDNKQLNQKSLIPLPVDPITTIPKARNGNVSMNPDAKAKSKSLNDLSVYCKQHFGVAPNSKEKSEGAETASNSFERSRRSFIPLKSFSKDDVRIEELDEFNKRKKLATIIPLEDSSHRMNMTHDDYGLGNSGNSSTGSGSSSDNAFEDTLEELNIFSDEVFKDLYKMDGQRSALQILDRLTARLNNASDFGQSLDSQQVKMLVNRLGTLAGRTRGRAGEAALQALRALVRTASDRALKGSIPALAAALAGTGLRSQGLLTDVGRRIAAGDLVEALLDESSPHWRSTKLRAGALRALTYAIRTLPCSGVRVSWACSRCAACARSPRRRVRAAALDALATLASLCSPRAVLAAVHKEAADHADGDQLYDAVLARLCRPAAPGVTPVIPTKSGSSSNTGQRRPDLAWIMAGAGDASPPPTHKLQRTGDEWIYKARGGSSALEHLNHLTTPLYTSRVTPSAEYWKHQSSGWEPPGPTRVLTAPPVALRPISLPSLGPPPPAQPQMTTRAVLWASHPPSQIDIQWAPKQETWPPLGGSWPRQQRMESRAEMWHKGGHPQLNTLSPNQQQGRWGWSHNQVVREDGFSPHEPSPQPQSQPLKGVHPGSEGHAFQRHHYPASAILLTIHNKIDERGEVDSHKSDVQSTISIRDGSKSPTGSTASLAVSISSQNNSHKIKVNDANTTTTNQVSGRELSPCRTSNHSTQINNNNNNMADNKIRSNDVSPAHSNHSIISNHSTKSVLAESSPYRTSNQNGMSPSRNQQPPIIDDFDEDDGVTVMPAPESRRSNTPSPQRFISKQESEEPYNEEVNERFVMMKDETQRNTMLDNVSVTSAKFSLKENMSASSGHSIKSQRIPSPLQEIKVSPVRTVVTSAPALSYLGSSVSTEEEVKSVESGFSEHSMRGSLSSEENYRANDGKVLENLHNGLIKKPPKKCVKLVSKTITSKISRNKIQPTPTLLNSDKPFDRPKEVLSKSLVQLESCDWETVMTGLRGMENLVKYHSVFLESHLTPVCRAIATQIKNLRSQVARAACRLAANLFLAQRKCVEGEADELAMPLLCRTADTNKFLRIDANMALDKMCESISPQKSISILLTRGTAHQNAIVRCTSARLLESIVKATGVERMFCMQKEVRDKLIQTGADLLTEGSLETRGHAKQLFKILSQNPLFYRILRDTIPLSKYRSIEKSLNNIKAQ